MTKFKPGDKVRRISGEDFLAYGMVLDSIHTVEKQDLSGYLSFGEFQNWEPGNFELVEPESLIGKRIKYEREGTIVRESRNGFIVRIGQYDERYLDKDENYEILPDPIILPTLKNALIELAAWPDENSHDYSTLRKYDPSGPTAHRYEWRQGNGKFMTTKAVQAQAEAFPNQYRVIFEGEK